VSLFFWLIVLLLPTQLGKHFWPDWSLVEGIRVDYLAPTLYVTDVLLIGLGCLLLFTKARRVVCSGLAVKQLIRLEYFLGFWWLIMVWSSIKALERPWLGWYWLARYLQILVVAWITVELLRRYQRFKLVNKLSALLVVGGVFSVGLGLLQVMLGRTTGWLWVLGERSFNVSTPGVATISVWGQELLRPYGTFSHPNSMGGYLAAVVVLLQKIQMSKSKLQKRLNVKALLGLGVILTASRVAIVSLLIGGGWGLGAGRAVNGAIIFSPESVEDRILLNQAAWRMFQDHPLTGVGPGQFIVALPKYLSGGRWLLQPVHNIPLLLLAEFGALGWLTVLVLIFIFLRAATSRVNYRKHWQELVRSRWLSVIVVILITGMFDHYWVTAQQNRLLLGLVLGLIVSDARQQR
jgi:hypothetical protein